MGNLANNPAEPVQGGSISASVALSPGPIASQFNDGNVVGDAGDIAHDAMDIENNENDYSPIKFSEMPLRGSLDTPAEQQRISDAAIMIGDSIGDNDNDSIGLEPMDLSDDQFEPSNNNWGRYSSTHARTVSGHVANHGQMIPSFPPSIDSSLNPSGSAILYWLEVLAD